MQKNNNNYTAEGQGTKNKQSFADWAKENSQTIGSSLIDLGLNFINDNAERMKEAVTSLILDDRWHYIDKPKKQSYRGEITYNSDGTPWLNLTYFTFRHGKVSVRFDCRQALKELWQQARGNALQLTPIKKPASTKPAQEKPIEPINWVARDFELWKSLAPVSDNHYLKRKGLANSRIAGLRQGKNFVAGKLINTQGEYQGLQKIYNDGRKLFTKGLHKKGHFILIGDYELPEKLERVHVCEGVATAASIHLATGEPVFSALDAFNLLPVCKNLKKHYPKTTIQIWADNDWQKAGKKNKEGKVLGNTGLIQANSAAFKLRGALVCTPDFSTFPLCKVIKATDFNDLHKLAGLKGLAETLPHQPVIELALWHALRQYNKRAHGVVSPTQFKLGQKINYDSRYLPQNIFEREGVHLVRSAIGTGKTEVVEKLVKKNPDKSVLFTTHLISLVESAASRLKLVSYNECDHYDLQIENRVAICLNSLGKLTAVGALRRYDIVVIDEIEQVLARLTTKIDQKPLIFSVLKHVMQNAKQLICLDAHLSHATVQIIHQFCPDIPITVHFNNYEPGLKRQIVLHDSPENLQMAAMKALDNQKSVYLAFNAKKEAHKTYCALKTAFPTKKGLYISSDNNGDKENRAFFNNVNKVSKLYDYIICTPSVSTGVSIDNNHFDFVGGVFNAQVNTANDCMQALGRVRNHQTLHVFCEKRLGFKPLSPEIISAKWSKTHFHDLSLMNIDDTGNQILLNPEYERLALLVTQARNRSFNDFYEQFCLLALHDGMKILYADEKLETSARQQVRQFKAACIEQDVADTEVLSLSAIELKQLANKTRKTLQETRIYKKQQIIDFYNLAEKDNTNIEALSNMDDEGRFRKQVLNLELALGNVALAKQRFLAQLEKGPQFAADLTHFASLQILLHKLLETLHLTTSHGLLSTEDFKYDADSLLNSEFFNWIEENRTILQGLINIPTSEQLKAHPLRFISALLAKMGLKQKRVGRADKGVYHVDCERTELLNALLTRRNSQIAGQSIPLDAASFTKENKSGLERFIESITKIKALFSSQGIGLPCPT